MWKTWPQGVFIYRFVYLTSAVAGSLLVVALVFRLASVSASRSVVSVPFDSSSGESDDSEFRLRLREEEVSPSSISASGKPIY